MAHRTSVLRQTSGDGASFARLASMRSTCLNRCCSFRSPLCSEQPPGTQRHTQLVATKQAACGFAGRSRMADTAAAAAAFVRERPRAGPDGWCVACQACERCTWPPNAASVLKRPIKTDALHMIINIRSIAIVKPCNPRVGRGPHLQERQLGVGRVSTCDCGPTHT